MIGHLKMVLRKYPDKSLVAVVIHFTLIINVNPVFQVIPVIEVHTENKVISLIVVIQIVQVIRVIQIKELSYPSPSFP